MGMTITRIEKTIIPQTLEGQEFANDYEKILTKQGVFMGRAEDTQAIVIEAKYYFELKEQNICKDGYIYVPDNATNGDALKTLFPYHSLIFNYDEGYMLFIIENSMCCKFTLNWWNAPYTKEQEDGNVD